MSYVFSKKHLLHNVMSYVFLNLNNIISLCITLCKHNITLILQNSWQNPGKVLDSSLSSISIIFFDLLKIMSNTLVFEDSDGDREIILQHSTQSADEGSEETQESPETQVVRMREWMI